jgi:uncharacterized protein (DUF433 family)
MIKRIVSTPDVCHGALRFMGTRIPITVVLANLAAGVPESEILKSYPTLSPEDIEAVKKWSAER